MGSAWGNADYVGCTQRMSAGADEWVWDISDMPQQYVPLRTQHVPSDIYTGDVLRPKSQQILLLIRY